MRRSRIITVLLLALTGILPVNAQYTFTISASWSGNCSGYTAQMNQAMGKFKSQAVNGFPTRELCEQVRAMCHQELGHIDLIWIDAKTGKEIKRQATNCKFNITTSPCTGRPLAGSSGTVNVLGVSQGTSFYSANTANEIQNWSSDDMERQLALSPNSTTEHEDYLSTNDFSFNEERRKIRLSGRMPEGSTFIARNDNYYSERRKDADAKYYISGSNAPLLYELGRGSSDDFRTVDITNRLSTNIYVDDKNKAEPTESFGDKLSSALHSLDEKLDWYKAEDPNVFQYIYTRVGKENIQNGIDLWQQYNIGTRVSNAVDWVKQGFSGYLEGGAVTAVKVMLQSRHDAAVENAVDIANTSNDVVGIVKNYVSGSVEYAARGEVPTTDPMRGIADQVNGLAERTAQRAGVPLTPSFYKAAKATAVISNQPHEKKREEAKEYIKKEVYSQVKSKIEKKAKGKVIHIIDPNHVLAE